jgi:aspartate aminotransferase-like enzyme
MKRKEKVLMIPGPSELSSEVLNTMSRPLPAHYMDDWVPMYRETVDLTKKVLRTKNDTFIITGSGSAGMEAACATIIEPGDKVIADVTGPDVFEPFVSAQGAHIVPLEVAPGTVIDPDSIRRLIKNEGKVKAVAIFHNVTSTGVTNPVDEIGKITAENNVLLLVDAISSAGGMPLEVDKWHIDICCAATQKAFSVPAGLALVTVNKKAWSAIKSRRVPIHSEYLNLERYKEAASEPQASWHPTPDTCNTLHVRALLQSLRDLVEEGVENAWNRHAMIAEATRQGLKSMGLELLVKNPRHASNTVTAALWPQGCNYEKFWRAMFDEYNIMLGNPPIKGHFPGWFRIGHMGTTANIEYILPTLAYIEMALRKAGHSIEPGRGVAAAQRVFFDWQIGSHSR